MFIWNGCELFSGSQSLFDHIVHQIDFVFLTIIINLIYDSKWFNFEKKKFVTFHILFFFLLIF